EGRPAGRHAAEDHRVPQGRDVLEDPRPRGRQRLPPGGAGGAVGHRAAARPARRGRPAEGVLREPRRAGVTPRPAGAARTGGAAIPAARFAFSRAVFYLLIVLNFWGEGEDTRGRPAERGLPAASFLLRAPLPLPRELPPPPADDKVTR